MGREVEPSRVDSGPRTCTATLDDPGERECAGSYSERQGFSANQVATRTGDGAREGVRFMDCDERVNRALRPRPSAANDGVRTFYIKGGDSAAGRAAAADCHERTSGGAICHLARHVGALAAGARRCRLFDLA